MPISNVFPVVISIFELSYVGVKARLEAHISTQRPARRHHASHRVRSVMPLDTNGPYGCRNEGVVVAHIYAWTGILLRSPGLAGDSRGAFSIGMVGNQIADFVLAKARLTLRSSDAQNFRFWGSLRDQSSSALATCWSARALRALSAALSGYAVADPALLAGTLTTTSVLAVRSSGRLLLVRPRRLVVGLRHHRPSRTPISSGSRASRLTSVSGFHQVDSMGISDATFRQGLVGSTWPGGCAESLSSAWPVVSLVGAGA